MKKWEHTKTGRWDEVVDLGNDGWELVGIDSAGYYMKREVVDEEINEKVLTLQNEIVKHLKLISRNVDRRL